MDDDNEISIDHDLYDDNQEMYIRNLKNLIRKQTDLIKTLRAEITSLSKKTLKKDSSTQTERHNPGEKLNNEWLNNGLSIEETVKQVAENAMNTTGFVYDATSGLYYDYNTGYYYNAERGLYYDGNSGIYYYYDQEKNLFHFHSQVAITQTSDMVMESKENADLKSTKRKKNKKPPDDYEEGECSDDSEVSEKQSPNCDQHSSLVDVKETEQLVQQSSVNNEIDSCVITKDASLDATVKAWPPCMRLIVRETNLDNLDVGTLFIVTCQGGTIGREGEHSVLIPDKNISKYHAKLTFDVSTDETDDDGKGNYVIIDLGSRNGTYLDGKRLSSALQESEPRPVLHKSSIKVGTTVLICHVHIGRETCPECEPGLLLPNKEMQCNTIRTSAKTLNKERSRKLKEIKKKFGLENGGNEALAVPVSGYEDKAEIRRKTVGSNSEYFKTETSSTAQPIAVTNAGYKMLAKMGWKTGDSLGTNVTDGIKDPISVDAKANKTGLGYENNGDTIPPDVPVVDATFRKKQEIWKKTRHRYKSIKK